MKIALRIIVCILGLACLLPAMAPIFGWVTDWETIASFEKLIFTLVTTAFAAGGVFLFGISSGLVDWILNKFD